MPLPIIGNNFAANNLIYGLPRRGLISLIVPGWDVRYGQHSGLVNLMGVDGNFEVDSNADGVADGWTLNYSSLVGITKTLTTNSKYASKAQRIVVDGSNGVSPNYLRVEKSITFENGKYYVVIVDFYSSSVGRCKLGVGSQSSSYNLSTNKYESIYLKFVGDGTSQILRVFLTNSNTDSASFTSDADGARLYEIDQATYNLIDVDPEYTGERLAAKLPYVDSNTATQSLADFSNHSNPFQLGSTSTADTNDPLYNAQGLTFATNQYMLSGVIAGLDMRSFSMQIVGKFNGASGAITSLSDSASTTKYQAIKQVSSGNVAIISRNAGSETQSASLTVSATDTVALMLTAKDGTLTLENQSTGATVTLADTAPVTTCRIGIGCVAASTVAQIISAMTLNEGVGYTRLLSTSERRQAYSASKRIVSALGVTVA